MWARSNIMVSTLALAQPVAATPDKPIDLMPMQECTKAPQQEEDVIVICGRNADDDERFRIPPEMRGAEDGQKFGLPKAEIALSEKLALAAEAEGADVGGHRSDRAMIRLKIKF